MNKNKMLLEGNSYKFLNKFKKIINIDKFTINFFLNNRNDILLMQNIFKINPIMHCVY